MESAPSLLWARRAANCGKPCAVRSASTDASPLTIVGAVNAYSALQAHAAGFRALYLSGGGVAACSLGVPDLGLTHLSDVVVDCQRISAATPLPVLVDADTGFGPTEIHISRTVQELERAGAAGIQIEDQTELKRCGHLDGKVVVSDAEMCARIRGATRARRDPQTVIVARTDAYASEGLAGVLRRARVYAEAGADWLFPEAVPPDALRVICSSQPLPVMHNQTEWGRVPLLHRDELRAMGVRAVLFPLTAFRAAAAATAAAYATLQREGTQAGLLSRLEPRAELYRTLSYAAYSRVMDAAIARL